MKPHEAAIEYCRKFPHASSRALGRMLLRDEPMLFSKFTHAYTTIRRCRGELKSAHVAQHNIVERQTTPLEARWGMLPQPKTEFDEWSAVDITDDYCALTLQDIHIPYDDRSALLPALEMGRKRRCNLILLNGDIIDCYAVSRWEPDPRKRNFKHELLAMRCFLEELRAKFKKARIIWKLGNHEERYDLYMQRKAPELLGINKFEFASVFHANDYGVEIVKDMRPIKLGPLFVIHGHEYKFAIQNPVNPARGLFLRAKKLALCGHFHRTSQHSEADISESVISTWSIGCLCDRHPAYMPINQWNHGHAIINTSRKGDFEVESYRTIDGVCYR